MVEMLSLQAEASLGDPGRIHHEGLTARSLLEHARQQVATMLGARQREIVFTSGASESIAAATWGAVRRSIDKGRTPHIVHAAVEHSAVRRASDVFTAAGGGSVSVIGVDASGRIDVEAFIAALSPETSLAHIQWGNHEVGTLQPLSELIAVCKELDVLVHVDATQAVGHVVVRPGELGIDLLSFSAHRLGGPVGIGVLQIRQGLRLEPLLTGGDQERARRAGVENVAAAVALGAVAEELDDANITAEADDARVLLGATIERLTAVGGVEVLGATDPDHRLPHLVCLAVAGVEPQGVVLGLDRRGIAVHSGSSCASEGLEPSPVLEAMGVDAHRSLRISVGHDSTIDDIDALCTEFPVVVDELRSLAG